MVNDDDVRRPKEIEGVESDGLPGELDSTQIQYDRIKLHREFI